MEFDIPTDLVNLWRYMHHMYHLDAFTQVCYLERLLYPSPKDLVFHGVYLFHINLSLALPTRISSTITSCNRYSP